MSQDVFTLGQGFSNLILKGPNLIYRRGERSDTAGDK